MPTAMIHSPPPRGRPRSPAKHRDILDAAISLSAERPYPTITMEAVAARAGVGKMTLYRRWPSKAALFLEAYVKLIPAESLVRETKDPVADLRHLSRTTLRIFRDTPAGNILRGLIADAQHDEAARAAVIGGLVAGRRELLTIPLQRAATSGRLAAGLDPDFAAEFLVGMIWQRLLTDHRDMDDAFADRLVDTVCKPEARP